MLPKLLMKLSYATIPLFWPVWLGTCAGAWWLSRRFHLPKRSGLARGVDRRSALAIGAFLVPYIAFLLWGADVAYHYDELLTDFTLSGERWPLAIWPYLGRYFPLHLQEFNALALLSATPACYYAFVVVQLVASCWLIDLALFDLARAWRVLAVVLVLVSNSVGIVFAEPLYPERNIVFAILALLVALQRFDQRSSQRNLLMALLSAHVALYLKEPVFLLLVAAAVTRLMVIRAGQPGWRWLRTRPLELGLLVLSTLFLAQFAASLLAFRGTRYVDQFSVGRLGALIYYARYDPALWGFLVALAVRAHQLWRGAAWDPVLDALAAGALTYAAALVGAGLGADRYMPPVDLIGVLFMTRQASLAWERWPARRALLVPVIAGLGAVSMLLGVFRLLEHKNVVRGTVALGEFVNDYAAKHPEDVRLYFPNSEGWRLMNFAAHLRYRHPDAFKRVHLMSPREFPEGRCVYYRPDRCEHTFDWSETIVAYLPDDTIVRGFSTPKLAAYRPLTLPLPAGLQRFLFRSTPLGSTQAVMPVEWLEAAAIKAPKHWRLTDAH